MITKQSKAHLREQPFDFVREHALLNIEALQLLQRGPRRLEEGQGNSQVGGRLVAAVALQVQWREQLQRLGVQSRHLRTAPRLRKRVRVVGEWLWVLLRSLRLTNGHAAQL